MGFAIPHSRARTTERKISSLEGVRGDGQAGAHGLLRQGRLPGVTAQTMGRAGLKGHGCNTVKTNIINKLLKRS